MHYSYGRLWFFITFPYRPTSFYLPLSKNFKNNSNNGKLWEGNNDNGNNFHLGKKIIWCKDIGNSREDSVPVRFQLPKLTLTLREKSLPGNTNYLWKLSTWSGIAEKLKAFKLKRGARVKLWKPRSSQMNHFWTFSSVQFSHSIVSSSLRPHES